MTHAARRLFAVAVGVAVALTGCSSDAKPGPDRFDAAAAATSLRALNILHIEGNAKFLEDNEGPIDGTVQYEPRRTLAHVPVGAQSVLADVEYRRIDDKAWVLTAESKQLPGIGFPILVVRPAGYARRWMPVDPTSPGAQGLLGRVFDPVDFLTAIAQANILLERDGEAKVDGKSRARFTARITDEQDGPLGASALSVLTDEAGLPVQFDFIAISGAEGSYTITPATADVAVEPPDPNQVELIEKLPTASGQYREVASGNAGGVAYRVLRAPASKKEFACWKVASTPGYVPYDIPANDGGICVHGILPKSDDPADQIAIPLDASSKTDYELLGLHVPPGTTVDARFAGGTERPVTVDANGLAIIAGPSSPAAGFATVTLPDRTVMYCAPGAINTPRDLEVVDVQEGAALRDQPWNCLEKGLAELLGD